MLDPVTPAASVIIPAHNEGSGILNCLGPVLEAARILPLEIIVSANGCTDNTVDLARSQQGVQVLDLATASKVGALKAADKMATAFPRIYLDADVELDTEAVLGMVNDLHTEQARLAVPSVVYNTRRADRVVRMFYCVQERLNEARGSTVGRGVYALSEAGRAKFGEFPDLMGDDLFVNRLFTSEEIVVSPGRSTVQAPLHWKSLVRIRSRLVAGNAELAAAPEAVRDLTGSHDFSRTSGRTARELIRYVCRRPTALPSAAVFVGVAVLARIWRSSGGWQRDESSR